MNTRNERNKEKNICKTQNTQMRSLFLVFMCVMGVCDANLRCLSSLKPLEWRTDLMACRLFEQATCCDRGDSEDLLRQHLLSAAHAASEPSMAFSRNCALALETALCMPCDPLVGTGAVRTICIDLCEKWFEACKDSLFTVPQMPADAPKPCGENALVCSKIGEMFSSGASLCTRFGLMPGNSQCYNGKVDTSLEGVRIERTVTNSQNLIETFLQRFNDWLGIGKKWSIWYKFSFTVMTLALAVTGARLLAYFSASRLPGKGRRLGST